MHRALPLNNKDVPKLEGRKPESQGTGTWDLHGEMKELDLFSCRNGQQWPCCSCEATEKREMGLYWGQPKGSEKTPGQTGKGSSEQK